jgi:type II secretory pathway predicted ATPase ExeA/pSer/pThr/pTyr-binding forkhead associated (FHA) protein
MELGAAGLSEQPFPTHGKPLVIASYASKISAIEALNETKVHPTGLALLQGPPLSGKSTVIRSFVKSLPKDCSVALIDGKGLNTAHFLVALLRQFGYNLELSSTNELLGLVRVFALQQTASHDSPLLIVENAHELNPSALRTLCELALLRVRQYSALKIVLVSDCSLEPIMAAHAMEAIAKRVVHNHHLRPMNRTETRDYLHSKLRAAGSPDPGAVFPQDTSRTIWEASGGWPGIVDRVAVLALAQTRSLPVTATEIEHPALPTGTWTQQDTSNIEPDEIVPPAQPRLIVTINGNVINDVTLDKTRALIGRSVHNDIAISSRFISRHHALLVRHGSSTLLMDLNSTNGTFVNSKRVSNHLLMHDDIITIGHHHIKFRDPSASTGGGLDNFDFSDTTIMKTLGDMRSLLTQEDTALLPVATEQLPTIRN